ncbi:purple acid phosphatase family protein [Flavitalea flava]
MKRTLVTLLTILLAFPLLSLAQEATSPNGNSLLLRGPYLQTGTPHSMIIRWRTSILNRGVVRYGLSPQNLDKTVSDNTLATEHILNLEGLQPETKYYYLIGTLKDTLQEGPDNYFMTLPLTGSEGLYRIAAFGDCGNNSVNQRAVRDQVIHYLGNNYMNSWILLGDNAYGTGIDGEYQSGFFNIYKDNLLKKYPLYPAPGNHDYKDRDLTGGVSQKTHEVAYYHNFSMPTKGEAGGTPSHNPSFYSFDLGNIHFLSLDSYGIEEDQYRLYDTLGPQVQWVKKDLDANQNKGWIVAYWHHPPYTGGSHNSDSVDELEAIRKNFIRILERYGVDLVLCGHSHDYERSKLMKGHYGMQASFNPGSNLVSNSSGFYDGSANSCPYIKDSAQGYQGTVYVVSGSAGQLGGHQIGYPHKALPYSDATHGGAAMLEVQGNRLDLKWICADGEIRDRFTMMKRVNRNQTIKIKKGESVTLTASYNGDFIWTTGNSGKSITVTPSSTTTYTVKDKQNCLKDTFIIKVVP